MAIYYHNVQVIGRSGGRSAVAAAAYRSGEKLEMVDGRVVDYSRRHGINHTEIMAPVGAADWMKDRQQLWHGVELIEKRKDAQLAREVQVSLPRELDLEQSVELVREYVQTQFVNRGMVADIAIHDAEKENPHAHVMLTMREIEGDSFGKKQREWNNKPVLHQWRESWSEVANKHLEQAGSGMQIDHRTLVEQGIVREPKNLSMAAYQMEHKGIQTRQGERQRAVERANRFARAVRDPANDWLKEAEELHRLDLQRSLQQRKERSISHELGR